MEAREEKSEFPRGARDGHSGKANRALRDIRLEQNDNGRIIDSYLYLLVSLMARLIIIVAPTRHVERARLGSRGSRRSAQI